MERVAASCVPAAEWWAAHAACDSLADQSPPSLPGSGYCPGIDYTALLIAGRVLPAEGSNGNNGNTESTRPTLKRPTAAPKATPACMVKLPDGVGAIPMEEDWHELEKDSSEPFAQPVAGSCEAQADLQVNMPPRKRLCTAGSRPQQQSSHFLHPRGPASATLIRDQLATSGLMKGD